MNQFLNKLWYFNNNPKIVIRTCISGTTQKYELKKPPKNCLEWKQSCNIFIYSFLNGSACQYLIEIVRNDNCQTDITTFPSLKHAGYRLPMFSSFFFDFHWTPNSFWFHIKLQNAIRELENILAICSPIGIKLVQKYAEFVVLWYVACDWNDVERDGIHFKVLSKSCV